MAARRRRDPSESRKRRASRIAATLSDDDLAQRGSKIGDVRLERRACSRRRLLAPETLDERVDRDGMPKLANEQPERGPLFRTPERDRQSLAHDLDRAGDPDVHVATMFLLTPV
jgi:hypothetical protein